MRASLWLGVVGLLGLTSHLAAQAPAKPPAASAPAATAQVKPAPAQVAATVNGEAIGLDELTPVVDAMIRDKFKTQPPTEAQKHQMRLEVLELMIDDVLMRQFLTRNGPKVDPTAVDKQLAIMASNLATQKRTLADFFKESGQTEGQIRANILHMIQWSEYVKTRITDAQVRAYYDENKEFFDQVTVRASHIVLRMNANAPAAEKEEKTKKLLAIKAEIEAKQIGFVDAAKKYSECPSAPSGGDIGYFSRKWMLEESFAKVAFGLKVGEISGVVQTNYGLHLIQSTDRKNGTPSDFEKIKDEVRGFCIEEIQKQVLAQERAQAKIVVSVP